MTKKYGEITKDILLCLAGIGAIAIAATSPFFLLNIAKSFKKSEYFSKKKMDERRIARAVGRLRKNRLIILNEENGKFKVKLTEKGKRKVKEIHFEQMEIKKPKVWDKKWRVVIFDIPDRQKRVARDILRDKLKKLNFYPLQKSVWAQPYPCEEEIEFLCELFDIWPFVNVLTAEKISNDVKLKEHFGLF